MSNETPHVTLHPASRVGGGPTGAGEGDLASEVAGLHGAGGAGRNLTYGLLELLGRAIVTGRYDAAVFPTEADLAHTYEVSRSVTREAVKMLTAKGLLTARPRKGTTIQPTEHWNLFDPDVLRWLLERKFSLQLLRHFNELRIGIEPAAAALASKVVSADALAEIERGFARMEAAEIGDDDTLEADIAFHIAILRATANPFYLQFCDLVETALRTSIRFTNRYQNRTASLPHHKDVMVAIAAGDCAKAYASMKVLIDDVLDLIEVAEKSG